MSKEKSRKHKIIRNIIITVLAAVVLFSAVVVGMCVIVSRPAVQSVEAYRGEYRNVEINTAEDNTVEIFPHNASAEKKTGIIFYVGAQITPDAYIPLLARLSVQGYSCFIPELTRNIAMLEPKAADEIIAAHPEIEAWYMAGHSLGGYTAADYFGNNPQKVDGLILIAAYTGRDISDVKLPVLSIYGDTDTVLNKGRYEKSLALYPEDFEEHIIEGANHAQFGDYGKQPRDAEPVISAESQQEQTAGIVLDWLERHGTEK